jgi:serine-type D-Ala-D-Ala carboxypeptidase (penicillin-binding protein 5/6)
MIRTHPRWLAPACLVVLLFILSLAVLFPTVVVSQPAPATSSATIATPEASPAPPEEGGQTSEESGSTAGTPGDLQCKSAILMRQDDGRILFEQDADTRRPIASTTKIMTGILALETLPLNQVVTASKRADAAGESEIWLVPGEQLTVEQLLYALLVKSANDAAVALAEAGAGSVEAWIDKMNAKAAELGLTNTHFTNPHGLDGPEHYSTARDLAVLGQYAMANDEFRRIVALESINIPWSGRDFDRVLNNRNGLIGKVGFVTGVKTGYTGKAGFCLVGSGSRDGIDLISVVLGQESKEGLYNDTVALLEYGFGLYKDITFSERDVVMADLAVPYWLDRRLELVTNTKIDGTVHVDDRLAKQVEVNGPLILPVSRGDVLGKVTFTVGGRSAGEVELVAAESIEAPSLGVKVRYFWARFIAWLGAVA